MHKNHITFIFINLGKTFYALSRHARSHALLACDSQVPVEGDRKMLTTPGRLLIADDEEVFLQTTIELLRNQGYHCDGVQDVHAARMALERGSYDTLIADINMPGNRNLEFLEQVHSSYQYLPVIIVTGYPSFPTALTSIRLEVVDYLVKPFEFDSLLRLIARAIEHTRLLQAVAVSRQHAQEWVQQLTQMTEVLRVTSSQHTESAAGLPWAFERYLEQTVAHLAGVIVHLSTTLGLLSQTQSALAFDACHTLPCPHLQAYRKAIRDTIAVLQKPKEPLSQKI